MKIKYMALGGIATAVLPFVPSCSRSPGDIDFSPVVTFSRYEQGHSWVISSVRITTNHEPETFQAFAKLQKRTLVPTGWLWTTQGTKGLSRRQLPAVGTSREFQIRAICRKGTWRTTLTVAGVDHNGHVFPVTTWKSPGKKIRSCAKPPKK